MRWRVVSIVFCASFLLEFAYGGVVGSEGRPGQILGKGAQRRYQHYDLDLNQNLKKDEDEEVDMNQMMRDMATEDEENDEDDEEIAVPIDGLQIDSFQIESTIVSRFATTMVSSRVKNWKPNATEVAFSVVLPEEAFIANFTMLINNKTVVGEVKEKEAAKATYEAARASGQSAGHVEQSPRRTNAFKISVNIGGEEKVEFQLTYQEVLTRTNDYYKHVINIRPGQVVKRMKLILDVQEDAKIKKFHIPKIAKDIGDMTNEQLLKMDDWSSELKITQDFKKNASHLTLEYAPTDKQQREYAANGINGQFVFLYDVERPEGGELKAVNGYFVHFFAPEIADPVPKHVIFVIDQSGSMEGAKIRQTKEAMNVILKDLSTSDYFNILTFSDTTAYWKEESQSANPDSLQDAQSFVNRTEAIGGTNINSALLTALDMLNANSTKNFHRYQPVIIFLTDGQATTGITSEDHILTNIAEKQRRDNLVAIHSISFGTGADFGLLKKISARNGGLARKIYEDSDAAIQLHGFYSEISHPLLTHVKINYLNETVDPDSIVSGDNKVYYKGSEVVTIGKLKDFSEQPEDEGTARSMNVMIADISGSGIEEHKYRSECIILPWPRPFPIGVGAQDIDPLPANSLGGFVERMWAYKTIKQILKSAENQVDNPAKKKELKDKALALSIKYNFVTELTSMVVVQDDKRIEPRFVEEKEEEGSEMKMMLRSGVSYSMSRGYGGLYSSNAHSPIFRSQSRSSSNNYGMAAMAPPGSAYLAEEEETSMEDQGIRHQGIRHQGIRQGNRMFTSDSAKMTHDDVTDGGNSPDESIESATEEEIVQEQEREQDIVQQKSLCASRNEIQVECDHPLVCNAATCDTLGTTIDQQATCALPDSCDANRKTCVCNYGYVRLNGECVEPRNCPHLNCSDNHMLMTGGCFHDCEGVCGQPLPNYEQCPQLCDVWKCICQRGFVRNAEGKCVAPKDCDNIPKTCTDPNAELNACGQQCTQPTCENILHLVAEQAQRTTENSADAAVSIQIPTECNQTCLGPPKCVCRPGFFLLSETDGQPKCVEISQCPSYQCGPNEALNPCGNACDRKCSLRGQTQPCSKMCDQPACWCKPGFFRNDKDECVLEAECEEKATDEFFFL